MTNPPGLVLIQGLIPGDQDHLVTIRLISIEASRVVIDVAAPSEYIDVAFDHLTTTLGEFSGPDGRHPIGEPARILDYSEIVFGSKGVLEHIIARPVVDIVNQYRKAKEFPLIPSASFGTALAHNGYDELPSHERFVVEPRLGTSPDSGLVYSAAPLDSTDHMQMFEAIETALYRSIA
jgi:hypothetical protein